jgi:hypothetical protein
VIESDRKEKEGKHREDAKPELLTDVLVATPTDFYCCAFADSSFRGKVLTCSSSLLGAQTTRLAKTTAAGAARTAICSASSPTCSIAVSCQHVASTAIADLPFAV